MPKRAVVSLHYNLLNFNQTPSNIYATNLIQQSISLNSAGEFWQNEQRNKVLLLSFVMFPKSIWGIISCKSLQPNHYNQHTAFISVQPAQIHYYRACCAEMVYLGRGIALYPVSFLLLLLFLQNIVLLLGPRHLLRV